MRFAKLVPLLAILSSLTLCGCGAKSYSSMSGSDQAKLKTNLELLAVAYKTRALEEGKSPANWAELSRHIQDIEMDIDLQVVKSAGYTVNWKLDVEKLKGDGAEELIIAQGADGPKVYGDGTVK